MFMFTDVYLLLCTILLLLVAVLMDAIDRDDAFDSSSGICIRHPAEVAVGTCCFSYEILRERDFRSVFRSCIRITTHCLSQFLQNFRSRNKKMLVTPQTLSTY